MLSRRACRQPSVVHHFGYGAESRFLARREPSALVHSPSSSTTSTRVVRLLAAAREPCAPVGSAAGAMSPPVFAAWSPLRHRVLFRGFLGGFPEEV